MKAVVYLFTAEFSDFLIYVDNSELVLQTGPDICWGLTCDF